MSSRVLGIVSFVALAGCQWILGIGERSAGGDDDDGSGGTAGAVTVGGTSGSGNAGTNGGNAGAAGTNGGEGTGASGGTSGTSGGSSGTCADPGHEAGAGGAAHDDAGEPVLDQTFVDVRFENASCARTGASGLSCSATATATRGDVDIVLPTREGGICSRPTVFSYDDRGNRYTAAGVRFASETETGVCPLSVTLIEGVSAELRYDFTGLSEGATEITLLQFSPQVGAVVEEAAFRRLPVSTCGGEAWMADGQDLLGRALGSVMSQGVEISYYPCRVQSNAEFTCPFVFRSLGDDRSLRLPMNTGAICSPGVASAFDNLGNELRAIRLDVANETTTNLCGLQRILVRAVPTLVTYRFGPVESNVERIAEIRIAPLGVDGGIEDIEIPGVPLER